MLAVLSRLVCALTQGSQEAWAEGSQGVWAVASLEAWGVDSRVVPAQAVRCTLPHCCLPTPSECLLATEVNSDSLSNTWGGSQALSRTVDRASVRYIRTGQHARKPTLKATWLL